MSATRFSPELDVSEAVVAQAIDLLIGHGADQEATEAHMLALAGDPMLARRLIDWIPEVFALVLATQLAQVVLPTSFSAKDGRGTWVQIPLAAEPIVAHALALGTRAYHAGPASGFSDVVKRSAGSDMLNQALNAGVSLEGATLSGPALLGVPAACYRPSPPGFWRRLRRALSATSS